MSKEESIRSRVNSSRQFEETTLLNATHVRLRFCAKKKMPKTANLSSTMFYNLHIGKGQCVDTQQQSLWREGTRCVRSWNRNTMITALKKKMKG